MVHGAWKVDYKLKMEACYSFLCLVFVLSCFFFDTRRLGLSYVEWNRSGNQTPLQPVELECDQNHISC
jgi:hypothetical protein